MPRVLLAEDEPAIADTVLYALRAEGFVAEHCLLGGEVAPRVRAGGIDLVVLDVGLPDVSGFEVCRRLRAFSAVPLIFLTARADEVDRVLGLELGADDYVTKPFSFRELVARIRAVSRRTNDMDAPPDTLATQQVGELVIDRRTRRVHLGQDELQLTAKEFDVLAYLASDVGTVRTRTDILHSVWDEHWYGPTKTVDAHVASIRKKLGNSEWITAVRGVGFRLEPPA